METLEHNLRVQRRVPLMVVFVALAASAGERSYRSGILNQIEIKDVTGAISVPTTTGQDVSIPLPFGINYQFQVQADMILYVGNCLSKDKRNYGSEWIVNDPVEFNLESKRTSSF